MSWTSISSIIKPLQQWYSEINSATLTGAIDVVVVEHEDGSFVSSPFHVRFGKLGVLKAREKIVDIEVNDEPVDIHMKLDEFGAAFFVEGVSGDEDDDECPPELATSPIPGSDNEERLNRGSSEEGSSSKGSAGINRSLINDFNALETSVSTGERQADDEEASPDKEATAMFAPAAGHKGKLNRKKRKRRQNMRHSRNSSRSSLKDIVGQQHDDQDSSESSTDGVTRKTSGTSEGGADVGNYDNDGDDENDSTPVNSLMTASSTPLIKASSESRLMQPPPVAPPSTPQRHGGSLMDSSGMTQSFMSQKSDENSLLLSRLGGESINSILDSQERLRKQSIVQQAVPPVVAAVANPVEEPQLTGSAPGKIDYYSEPELSPVTSPIGSRPSTPTVLSDTEYETKRQTSTSSDTEQSWEWGKLPSTSAQVLPGSEALKDGTNGAAVAGGKDEKAKKDSKRYRSWTLSFWSKKDEEETESPKKTETARGVYLDDIKDDQEMLSIYVGSHQHGGSGANDDAESGNGPSLPMSPHSVEGAVGGARVRYDSSDDEHRAAAPRLLRDVSISLCGGFDKDGFTTALFEQSLVSYDDFEMHLRNPSKHQLFNDPNLVVRVGGRYYGWPDAIPVIMSLVLYGRELPQELADKGAKIPRNGSVEALDKEGEASPSIKKSGSSWWPFTSSRPVPQAEGDIKSSPGLATAAPEVEASMQEQDSTENKAVKSEESQQIGETKEPLEVSQETIAPEPKQLVEDKGIEFQVDSRSREETPKKSDSSEGESDPDLRALREGIKSRKFKKSLRLTSKDIKRLNLRPGVNEVQFSVTTAYQGTTRCRCHVYWWRSTDKIVISDIDGTITKSDVLGHVLPIIGRDWAQSGVASLFTKIVDNGYHIAYLSARAIGQASITKDYLKSISQGDVNLPDGPLFLNPTSLVNAFHREVIEKKPEKFKIACLRDIQKLFPGNRNPFYAGYGNRVNDVFAYRTVGIPLSRIFTINPNGELRHELTQTFQTSYDSLSMIADHVFPPIGSDAESPTNQQEFSSFAFWRDGVPALEEERDAATVTVAVAVADESEEKEEEGLSSERGPQQQEEAAARAE